MSVLHALLSNSRRNPCPFALSLSANTLTPGRNTLSEDMTIQSVFARLIATFRRRLANKKGSAVARLPRCVCENRQMTKEASEPTNNVLTIKCVSYAKIFLTL